MKNKKTTQSAETELILKRSFWKSLGKQKQLIVMSLPFVLYIILFKFVPLSGWTMAFQDYKPAKSMLDQTWVGFKWFLFLFKDKEFLFALRNNFNLSNVALHRWKYKQELLFSKKPYIIPSAESGHYIVEIPKKVDFKSLEFQKRKSIGVKY